MVKPSAERKRQVAAHHRYSLILRRIREETRSEQASSRLRVEMSLTHSHMQAPVASTHITGPHPRSCLAGRHMYPQDLRLRDAKHVLERHDKATAGSFKDVKEAMQSLE